MTPGLRFEGGMELAKALEQLSPRVRGSVAREVLANAAEPLRKRAASLAPRAPGLPDLADNIVISSSRSGDENQTTVAFGPSKAFFYGSFLELGTFKMSPRQFMRPSFDGGVQQALDDIKNGLWSSLAGRGVRREARITDEPLQGEV